jgi:predicted ATPase
MAAIPVNDRTELDGMASALVHEITPCNLLSFGPATAPLSLRNLNVLIGPNGSGKSSLIDLIALARATPNGLRSVLRKGGGVREWIWKGDPTGRGSFDLVLNNPRGSQPLRHVLQFTAEEQSFRLVDERVENRQAYTGYQAPYLFYSFREGRPVIMKRESGQRSLSQEEFDLNASVLSQIKDPEVFPEITHLVRSYEGVRIYREWAFGGSTVFREPQLADGRTDRLEENFSNLGLFLNRLRRTPRTKKEVLTHLGDLYSGLDDFDVSVEGGTVQVFFTEGDFTIPATRLSDGTLRYLCLLAILCDPEPPPLICLEEPELGLHPDLLPRIARLLIEASERTQLIVTTHSEILVDALTEVPETVIVCEKEQGTTSFRRLDPEQLKSWLGEYRLGQVWLSGGIGGVRW